MGQCDLESLVTSLNVARLAKPMREQWELFTDSSKTVPHMDEFVEFVRRRADVLALDTALEEEQGKSPKPPSKSDYKQETRPHHKKVYQPQRQKAAVHASSAPTSKSISTPTNQGFKYNYILCVDKHTLYLCPRFNNMDINQRSEHMKVNRLCFNCLAPGHKTVIAGVLPGVTLVQESFTPWCTVIPRPQLQQPLSQSLLTPSPQEHLRLWKLVSL